MSSARDFIKREPRKRAYKISDSDKKIIEDVAMTQPAELSSRQVKALAVVLRHSPERIKAVIAEARDNFVASSTRYVEIHRQAAEAALANGDAKSLDVATKAAQWAIESVSEQGARIIDQDKAGPTGTRVMIGIRVGGIDNPVTTLDIPTSVPAEIVHE
jgi:hypothetical protein